jgi:uncharacterized protein (DUF58 family)
VNPLAARLRTAMLTGRRRPGVRGAGAPVKRRSDGYEFAELRGYVAGDDPRRIDWAATARAGALQTRVVFEDHALTFAAALDASGSMFVGRTRSNYDIAGDAAAFWYGAAIDDDRCARVTADGLVFARDLRGRVAARLCTEQSEARGAPFGEALEIALAALPRSANLLLISDFFEIDAFDSLLRACSARFDVTALLVSDPWKSGLPLGGFVRLRDAESGETGRYFIGTRERDRYLDAVETRERRVLGRLMRLGIRTAALDEGGPEIAFFEAFGIA